MKVFDIYSQYYDLLYKDKDYAKEVDYINQLIKNNSVDSSSILDLGCGTGKHDFNLAKLGYHVTGVDLSESMIAVAKENLETTFLEEKDKLTFEKGDIRNVRVNKKFDTVVSLFHVMSYQTSNDDLKKAFETAAIHLNNNGLFIFDFWYGPGVLSDPPVVRIKRLENDSISVCRITEPVLHSNSNVVDVHFEVQITNKEAEQGVIQTLKEVHSMRYLFLPELLLIMENTGFEFIKINEWMSENNPLLNTWYATIICKKIKYS
jgi:SAM-dependent methyltransferase